LARVTLVAVPPGEIATVVTSLRMTLRPRPQPMPPSPLRLVRWPEPRADAYRALFRRVGAPWLWFSRLLLADDALLAAIRAPAVEVYAVIDRAGIEVGLLELDFRTAAACELSYLALIPELTGKGHGRWLMAHALALAWRKGITRVWVHTCSLDHPAALAYYQRAGFVPYARAVETFTDPRLIGVLPADAAPQIPLLGRDTAT
jgi:GNAT superfamily N-acetyltransferase